MNRNRLSLDHLEHILAEIESSVCVIDQQRRVIYVNNVAKQRIFLNQDLYNRSMYEVFPGLTQEASMVERVFNTGLPELNRVCIWNNVEHRTCISLISIFPIKDGNEIVAVCEVAEPLDELSRQSRQFLSETLPQINVKLQDGFKEEKNYYTLNDIVGESPLCRQLKQNLMLAAQSPADVLIYGETGSGKELVAQAIYTQSCRPEQPLIAQNCAAIPESLLESSLFGTVKGSFTDAETRPGLFELANSGILFLDEINSMPLNLQAKLLRTLQERKVRRVGGLKEVPVNFRLITSSNSHPQKLLREGLIRPDLFYRISIIYLEVPPLRQRREDIPLLVRHFLNELNPLYQKNVIGFDQESMDYFLRYAWPGNVRELKNVVERSINMSTSKVIAFDPQAMFPYQTKPVEPVEESPIPSTSSNGNLKQAVAALEERYIRQAVAQAQGNLAQAARGLGIPAQSLQNKIKSYDLEDYVRQLKQR